MPTPRRCMVDASVRIETMEDAIFPARLSRRSVGIYVVTHRTDPQRASWIGARIIETNRAAILPVEK